MENNKTILTEEEAKKLIEMNFNQKIHNMAIENGWVGYEKMWNELKIRLKDELEFRESGIMQSIAESTWCSKECQDILNMMEEVEKRNKINL